MGLSLHKIMDSPKYPYWTPENPSNTYARLGSANPYDASYYKNRSFVRLQNVSLAYRLPDKIIRPWNIQALKIGLNLQNLFVISGWDYWDPETLTATPLIGTFSINITL